MTKQEQNDIIKRVWTEHLQRRDEIPATLADDYSLWLRGIIREAANQLTVGNASEAVSQEPAQPAEGAA